MNHKNLKLNLGSRPLSFFSPRYLWLLIFPFLYGFKFSPMTQTISLEKGKGKTKFEVVNTTSSPIPVVIKLLERHQNADGSERLPKTSELKAFPPQLVVPPNDKRSIRVDYIGKKNLKGEKAFRVVAEQVPLNIPKKGEKKSQNQSGIKMLCATRQPFMLKPAKSLQI